MPKRSISKVLTMFAACVAVLACVGLALTTWSINNGVRERSALAREAHPKAEDSALALMEYISSESHSLEQRNRAVWALGRLGDARGLTVLQSSYSGEQCVHEAFLCQHELEKAIKRCGGTPVKARG